MCHDLSIMLQERCAKTGVLLRGKDPIYLGKLPGEAGVTCIVAMRG
jgi:hypothetical protein